MRPSVQARGRIAALVAIAFGTCAQAEAQVERPTLTVHLDRPAQRISPRLFGVFFEEINHAGDGGLYAELVRNRDFEEPLAEGDAIPGWSLRAPAGATTITLDASAPQHAANPHALRLDVAEGPVAVVAEGYWGIAVRSGATYRLSLLARADRGLGPSLRATLESRDGRVLCSASLDGVGAGWSRHECELTCPVSDPDARLALEARGPGRLWLDVVSLFPKDTWRGRTNGLRADLAELVAAARPAFVRFPGGCYVEGGDKLANAFRWPATLGDIAARPGHANETWGYRSTDGLGFHEYLQRCEDLGAEPLFVVNCGMAHQECAPLDALGPWIDEALGALEYANGAVTTRWGAERARNGHPEPFGLKLVEIGNENGMFSGFGGTREQYAERYERFRAAIAARWPDVRCIANTRVPHPVQILDDHTYASPAWFWENVGLYDHADRAGPRIYVGEYAVTSGCGHGNLRAALAEAAFLTGLQRNSDVVEMASYAPLFVNVHDRRWNPDAIVFDGARSYGTPSWWVQRILSENRPDVLLPVDVPDVRASGATRGTIGLGTWRTQAEYKDVEVLAGGRRVYAADFAQGAAGWSPKGGDWTVADGAYRQSSLEDDRRALLELPELRDAGDYVLHLRARKLGGDEGFLVLFRAAGDGDFCWWNVGGWGNREHAIEKSVGGARASLGAHVAGGVETGRWYDLRIELEGDRVCCFLDGALVHDERERAPPTLAAFAGLDERSGEVVLEVVNGAERALEAAIELAGAARVDARAQVTVLTGASLDDENDFDAPERVAPRRSTLDGAAQRFVHRFEPRSLTVLRVRASR